MIKLSRWWKRSLVLLFISQTDEWKIFVDTSKCFKYQHHYIWIYKLISLNNCTVIQLYLISSKPQVLKFLKCPEVIARLFMIRFWLSPAICLLFFQIRLFLHSCHFLKIVKAWQHFIQLRVCKMVETRMFLGHNSALHGYTATSWKYI